MSCIRSKRNRTTEYRLRAHLVKSGIRNWTLTPHDVYGSPDFVFRKLQIAIFVDGCFWHVCPKCCNFPKTNAEYWHKKLSENRDRDLVATKRLRSMGWAVLRFWEHEVKDNPKLVLKKISRKLVIRGLVRRYAEE
jgi:DNA mismatch endonuclease (patch repair protein)